MADKVRRVDFSPDEYISGVNGMTAAEQGVYWMVCALIYSRGEPVDNDAQWIGRAAGCRRSTDCRVILDGLIARGKLTVNAEGKLENGRTIIELGRARRRVEIAREKGRKGGRPKAANVISNVSETHLKRTSDEPVSADIKGLAKTQPSTLQLFNSSKERKEESDDLPAVGQGASVAPDGAPPTKPTTRGKRINGAGHGQRIPDDWRLTPDLARYAEDRELVAQDEADAFVDHWRASTSKHAIKRDWNAAFRIWCRISIERRASRHAAPQDRPSDRPARGGGLVGAAARIRARYQGS